MPIVMVLFASASLAGCAKAVFNALSDESVEPQRAASLAPANESQQIPSVGTSLQATWQKWRQSATSALTEFEEEYHQFIRDNVDPLFGSTRETQIQQVDSDSAERALSPYERQINRNLGLSVVVTAAAIATIPFSPVVQLAATLPPALYVVKGIYEAAYESIVKKHKLTLPVLSAINVTAIWLGGYYLIGGVVLTLIHVGMKLSLVTEDRSHKRLGSIFGKQPQTVWILRDGVEIETPFAQLQVGDTVVISAGQMIAVDGVIIHGYASIDQRLLTGESQPAEKGVGDKVLAATVVLAGNILVRAEKAGQETAAAKIGDMLEKTASYQMDITTKAYQIAEASVAPTLIAAGLALFAVGYSGMVAITSTVFGFNLRISGPLALLNYLNVSARQSILIKDGRALEMLTSVDTVVFDKTGTLTLDQPRVSQIRSFAGYSGSDVLLYAATAEQRQSHPVALAILSHAKEQKLSLLSIDDTRYEVGYGLCAEIAGKRISVGSERFMALEQISLPAEARSLRDSSHALGNSLVMVAVDDKLVGAIELEPTIRPEAKAVIDELHRRKLKLYVISGDQEGPTRRLASTLGIDNYFADTLPENKAQLVEKLQSEGRSVCFVGDGINDSIALKKANVSISLSGATSVATDTAQIVLMDSTLRQLPVLFKLADEMDENLKTSLALAMIPGIGIWAGVFFLHLGILGAAAIYEASLWVGIGNAFRPLLKYQDKSPAA